MHFGGGYGLTSVPGCYPENTPAGDAGTLAIAVRRLCACDWQLYLFWQTWE